MRLTTPQRHRWTIQLPSWCVPLPAEFSLDRFRPIRDPALGRVHPARNVAVPSPRSPSRAEQGHFRALQVRTVDLAAALPPGKKVDDSTEWTRVTATGTYDLAHQVTVKFTTRDRAPGVDVVTPLVMADGTAVLVDRGWITTTNTVANPDVPAPQTGTVTVMGWLRQNNGAGGQATRPVDGQIRAISSIGMAEFVPYPLTDGYLNLQTQDPAASDALAVEPKPELGQGPHFFYGPAMVVLRPAGDGGMVLVRLGGGQGASQPHPDRRICRAVRAGQTKLKSPHRERMWRRNSRCQSPALTRPHRQVEPSVREPTDWFSSVGPRRG